MDRTECRTVVNAALAAADRAAAVPVRIGAEGRRILAAATRTLSALGRIHWVEVGSGYCHTSVHGVSDVDIVAVFLDPIRHGIPDSVLPYRMDALLAAVDSGERLRPVAPAVAYDVFADRLLDLAPSAAHGPAVRDFPAVRLPALDDGQSAEPSVELVPGCEADFLWDSPTTAPTSGLVQVAFPAYRDRWVGTAPELHRRTLDLSPSGADFSCRTIIRLLKIVKHERQIPILSYFIDLFVMRWMEGSHTYPARSVTDMIEQAGTAWVPRNTSQLRLVDALPQTLVDLSTMFAEAVNERRIPAMVDLTTPEVTGVVSACADDATTRLAAARLSDAADDAMLAHAATDWGDERLALRAWATLAGPAGTTSDP